MLYSEGPRPHSQEYLAPTIIIMLDIETQSPPHIGAGTPEDLCLSSKQLASEGFKRKYLLLQTQDPGSCPGLRRLQGKDGG